MAFFIRKFTATGPVLYQHRCLWRKTKSVLNYDLVVVGGGVVGAATAREIAQRHPKWSVAIVEKEACAAVHQSSHNSGVIHAGIYYKPGSLKAKLCVEGMQLMYDYLDAKNIPYKKCGKLIVATDESELAGLNELHRRGLANNVRDLQLVDADKIAEIEPYCEGVQALWSPHTGIVDYTNVVQSFILDFNQLGGDIHFHFKVKKFVENKLDDEYPIVIQPEEHDKNEIDEIHAKYVLTCGGLHSDKLAEKTGCSPAPRIIPFRGEYLLLDDARSFLIRGNVYPVPDPKFPFLGVHFTPRMDGKVWVGPNAVLAFKREGYQWWQFSILELTEILRYRGFRRLAKRYWRFGLTEMFKSTMKSQQMDYINRYYPDIHEFDLSPGPTGVRAQAVDEDGNLVDDFVFDYGQGGGAIAERILHCRNAPSPGATSSLSIARKISDKLDKEFKI